MGQQQKNPHPLRMAPPSRRDREAAITFVRALLRSGPVPVTEVRTQARAAHIPLKYLKEAGRHLRVELIKSGFGRTGFWSWQLPAA